MNTRDPREHWDQQAPIYASTGGHRQFDRFLALYETDCWRYIEAVLPPAAGSLILEAGCGTGRWVYRLAPMGYHLVLSDLSPEMIGQAQARVQALDLSDFVTAYHVLDICDLHALAGDAFDLVLALGGPLTLCRDARLAAAEIRRVLKPGGYAVCDVANRYRTALELVEDGELDQLASVLDTGRFSRPDGLTDHRFGPQELANLFQASGLKVLHMAGLCPFFDFLPSREQVRILEDDQMFAILRDVSQRYAQHPAMIGLSGRLLVVVQNQA